MEKSKGSYLPAAKTIWRVIGNCEKLGNWKPNSSIGKMKQIVRHYYIKSVTLLPGRYEFKFVKNGDWNDSIGSNQGENFSFTLSEEQRVTFYLNDDLEGMNKVRISVPGTQNQGLQQYVPLLSKNHWPRLVGDFQRQFGAGENWAPLSSTLRFVDYYFNGEEYRFHLLMQPGSYQCKVVFGDGWDSANCGCGNDNYMLEVPHTANVEFVVHGSNPNRIEVQQNIEVGRTERIDRDFIFYDSQSPIFKRPFGAISLKSESVTFRFQTKRYNVESVKLDLLDTKGKSTQFPMQVVDTIQKWDYWEVTVPREAFYEVGIWKYQFILLSGMEKIEYRGDGCTTTGACFGGTFHLTVYDNESNSRQLLIFVQRQQQIFEQVLKQFIVNGDAKLLAHQVLNLQEACPRETWNMVFCLKEWKNNSYLPYFELLQKYVQVEKIVSFYPEIFLHGEYHLVYAKDDTIVYARKGKVHGCIFGINRGDETIELVSRVGEYFPDGLSFLDQLEKVKRTIVKDGKIHLSIEGKGAILMISEREFKELPMEPALLWADIMDGVGGSITLSWESVLGADSYEVYRTYLTGMDWSCIGETTELTYEDRDVLNGVSYTYAIKAKEGGLRSDYSNVITACSNYIVGHLSKPSDVPDLTLGVGNVTDDIFVDIAIPGLTDNANIANRNIRGLKMTLIYSCDSCTQEKEISLQYSQDVFMKGIISKRYIASFEPTYFGTYRYYAKADLSYGNSITFSAVNQLKVEKPDVPFCLKTAPVLSKPTENSNYVTLNWTCNESFAEGYFVLRSVYGGNKKVIAILSKEEYSYTDYGVCNDCVHEYQIVAFDAYYHRLASNSVSIMPKLYLVDVTIQLVIPDVHFLSPTDKYYIACDANGWQPDGWEMVPSCQHEEYLVEYKATMVGGERMEYKFTRGTWDTQCMTSPALEGRDTTEDFGFSFILSNLTLIVEDQGNHKMLVKHYVIRWNDAPFILKKPVLSYKKGDYIELRTKKDRFSLYGKVPYGVICYVCENQQKEKKEFNERFKNGIDDFGILSVEDIPLKVGENVMELEIMPSEEAIIEGWFADLMQRKSLTDYKIIKIIREEDTEME